MDMGLAGKKAIILGGSWGIGWYTADLMREEGAEIAICARGAEGVQEAVEKLQAKGGGTVFGRAANLPFYAVDCSSIHHRFPQSNRRTHPLLSRWSHFYPT